MYHLAKDPAEQHDLAKRHPRKAQALRARLDAWLKITDAKLPTKDSAFDLPKREARWESLKTKGKGSLEKRHASYLAPGYKPNRDWWGSAPVD